MRAVESLPEFPNINITAAQNYLVRSIIYHANVFVV